MSDQELPLSPDKRMESAEMDLRLSCDPACAHTMEDAEFAECASGAPEALCSAVEQARNCQGHVEVNDVAAVDSRGFFERWMTPATTQLTRWLILVQ